ncbi:hypothetical protein [Rhodoplanes roseus]|uniref:Uncharacterized protein n=1 Tax=Rhodoplanes roseus TaxID=29409 RepID=A0A327L2G4_9BRAD|nr:hypothetical protein [Rhodoplanes roseus]RAI45280.1 hypothetical protein CH341_04595 [Rhodoplanes roseus]
MPTANSAFPANLHFDRVTMATMEAAFDRVCGALGCGHALTLVKMAAAMHIMTLAQAGERDPERLSAQALLAIGFRPTAAEPPLAAAPTVAPQVDQDCAESLPVE